jgi:hypothetical protein
MPVPMIVRVDQVDPGSTLPACVLVSLEADLNPVAGMRQKGIRNSVYVQRGVHYRSKCLDAVLRIPETSVQGGATEAMLCFAFVVVQAI